MNDDLGALLVFSAIVVIVLFVRLLPGSDSDTENKKHSLTPGSINDTKNKKHLVMGVIVMAVCFVVPVILGFIAEYFEKSENGLSFFDLIFPIMFFSLIGYIGWHSSKNDPPLNPKWKYGSDEYKGSLPREFSYAEFEEKRAKLLVKLDETLKAIDKEKGHYYGSDWDIVELWKQHAKRDIPSYGYDNMDEEIYRLLIETLDVGLADIRAGKNPYDSEHLLYEFAPKPEEENDEEK